MSLRLRRARPEDADAVREICIRTGDAGRDATGTLPDAGILADVYALPYLALAPDLATVVEGAPAGRVLGYVLGTADTAAFVTAWRQRWLPVAAPRHPVPVDDPTDDYARLVSVLHRPEALLTRWIDAYPAHLHIDLLPPAQGRGLGRWLLERFCGDAAAAGATGVHLGVDARNTAAQGFYTRVGFTRLGTEPGVAWFGRRLPRPAHWGGVRAGC